MMFGIQNGVGAALASALLLVTGAASESAGAEPVDSRQLSGAFTPDPEGVWRMITPSDSTSECIGDPVAPLCAVEFHLACYRRREPDLCRVAYGPEWEEEIIFSTYPHKTFFSYRVKKTWLTGPKDLEPLPNYAFNRELGDLMIDVIVPTYWTESGYCSTPIILITLYRVEVRRTLGRRRDLPPPAFNEIQSLRFRETGSARRGSIVRA